VFNLNYIVDAEPISLRESYLNEHLEIIVRFTHIDELRLVLNNETLSTESFKKSPDVRSLALRSNTPILATGMETYIILGFLNSTLLFTTHREFRYVPSHRDYLKVRQGITTVWDFTISEYVGVYNIDSDPERGWNVGNGTAVVNDGLFVTSKIKGWFIREMSIQVFRSLLHCLILLSQN
jgi:hypothetical protein